MNRYLLIAALAVPALVMAEGNPIGKVSTVEGNAARGKCAKAEKKACEQIAGLSPIAKGDAVYAGDVIDVKGKGGVVRVTLNDETVMKIGGDSQFYFESASFSDQGERQGFFGSLSFGSVWAKVKKAVAGSDQKFNISAGRAVAGVRGTIFRIDAIPAMKGATGKKAKGGGAMKVAKVTVMVKEGKVGVDADFKPIAKATTQPAKGERKQVPGPQEISLQEWEKRFLELQANTKTVIGDSPDSFVSEEMNAADQAGFEGLE